MYLKKPYYGAAYYAEYMPVSRIEEDMALMEAAGMNVIRVAESAWSTWEPREGEFDFSLLLRVLAAARRRGIGVIVGTPTYAIPPWLAGKYPDILAETHDGPGRYGHRQNMDITHPGYRARCEIIIRRLMEAVAGWENVIGFQLDNETKPYDTCSPRVQALFLEHLKARFGTVEAMNRAYGLAYWSNSLGTWEDMPDVRGTICGSLAAEFEAFQRQLVTEFLAWQRAIVDEYRRADQFVTHNFDFAWAGWSWGLQPDADQFAMARHLTAVGCDIYHPSGDRLTGRELSLCGDIARALAGGGPFQVLETQAQGQMGWLPHPGQLRLQALAHLANGADMVEYWHWHSIHNGAECYWKGVLSHDFTPGAVYQEAAGVGRDLARLGERLVIRRRSEAAILVSGRSLTGVKHSAALAGPDYNRCLCWLYDAFFRLNIPCDILPDTTRDFSGYKLVAAPCLYCAEEGLIAALRAYAAEGGHLLASFRSFFADEHVQIRHAPQPYGMTDVFGLSYDTFTLPVQVPGVSEWMELLRPAEDAQVLAAYDHPAYAGYAAAVFHPFGRGSGTYLGAMLDQAVLGPLLEQMLPRWGIALPPERWPLVVKEGTNALGQRVRYLLNYAPSPAEAAAPAACTELLSSAALAAGETLRLPPWGAAVLAW